MDRPELIALAKTTAIKYSLIPSIVCAVCEQESSWNPEAQRYESAFYVRYIEPMVFNGTIQSMDEAIARATSYGLMQVMGETARELGYEGPLPYPDEQTQIDLGCKKLLQCSVLAHGDTISMLLRYNGGFNTLYAKQVLMKTANYKETQ
jgi:soluble lytic murein transglycosylase-like protein